jgi:hypothetical protein
VRLIIKVYEKLGNKLQEGMMGQVSRGNTERSFCFQVLLKPVLTYGRWKTWAIPDHKRSMSGSQALVAHACNSSYSGGRDCCRKNVRPARTRLKPRWFEERKIYYGTCPIAQGCRVFMPQNVEASKLEGQKQIWQLASCWEVTTYHSSTRLQLIH